MTLHVDYERLTAAHQTARRQLLAERNSASHWTGELSSSPLATATAISALVLARQDGTNGGLPAYTPGEEPSHADEIFRGDLSEQLLHSLHWLAKQQNEDGGWGDTDRRASNIAATMLVQAAFHLTAVPAKYAGLLERANAYVASQGGIAGLRRHHQGDKTCVAPILANCALADMVPWRKVPAVPFELACLPQKYSRHCRPAACYAISASVAAGTTRFYHAPPRNPFVRWLRHAAVEPSLQILEARQPDSGGFLETTPLTSFVVMSLVSTGRTEHPVARRGIEFLLAGVRPDGSWPLSTNMATWNTSQALTALAVDLPSVPDKQTTAEPALPENLLAENLQEASAWLLECQHRFQHRETGRPLGGWSWTDRRGGLPTAEDTAAALLAVAGTYHASPPPLREQVRQSVGLALAWLLESQHKDGGWGNLADRRSGPDLTAQVLRALHVWTTRLDLEKKEPALFTGLRLAMRRGQQCVERGQQGDRCWYPLWFGNPLPTAEVNPVYATAQVLQMYQQLGCGPTQSARRAAHWLVGCQLPEGGWGPAGDASAGNRTASGVVETAVAIEALLPRCEQSPEIAASVSRGLAWLVAAVLDGRPAEPTHIGFYLAKLWYDERLCPQIFATRALASAHQFLKVQRTPAKPSS